MNGSAWYAIASKPKHEFRVQELLAALDGVECFLPSFKERRRWSDRIKLIDVPLFGRYLFARFDIRERRIAVLRTPGVIEIVGSPHAPPPVSEQEIDGVRALLASGFPLRVWPFLKPGQTVRINSGPLKGAEGVVVKQRDEWHMVVNVSILNRSVAVVLPRADVAALGGLARSASLGV